MVRKRDPLTIGRVADKDDPEQILLDLLALNKRTIDTITIRQIKPLSDECILLLNLFPELNNLEFWCPIANEDGLKKHLPKLSPTTKHLFSSNPLQSDY